VHPQSSEDSDFELGQAVKFQSANRHCCLMQCHKNYLSGATIEKGLISGYLTKQFVQR
jgi:hypothetical protein